MKNDSEYEKTSRLLQELIEQGKETDRKIEIFHNIVSEMSKETDRKIEKLHNRIDRIKESRIKEADRKFDELHNIVGGIEYDGNVTEEFFHNSFKKMMSIGDIDIQCGQANYALLRYDPICSFIIC